MTDITSEKKEKKKTNKKINHYITCIRICSSIQVRAPTNRVENFVDFTRGSAVFVVSWLIPGRTLKCFIWSICEILYLWSLALLNTVCFYQFFSVLHAVFLSNLEVNRARHETVACPCHSGGNHSVSERLVNSSLMLVLDGSRKSTWLVHSSSKMACLWSVDVLVPLELSY